MEQVALTSGDDEKAKVQSVLLLTDGLANEGITGTANILNVIKKFQEEGQGAVETYVPVASPPLFGGRQPRVQNIAAPAKPGLFGWLFGNRSSPAQPPPVLQQQAPQMQMQQAPQMPVQQQAPQIPVQQQAPPSMPKLDVNEEEEAIEVDESEPKPKPSGPKVSHVQCIHVWFRVRMYKTFGVLFTEYVQKINS